RSPKSEGKNARDSKKAWVRESGMRNRTPGHRITRRTTLLHTQASDRTPGSKSGAFFLWIPGVTGRAIALAQGAGRTSRVRPPIPNSLDHSVGGIHVVPE